MFRKILVAIDKTDISQRAFDEALTLAQRLGAELRLLHVLSFSDPDSPNRLLLYSSSTQLNEKLMKQYEQDWNTFVAEYGEYLQALTKAAQAQGVEVSYYQAYGSPGPVICEVAKNWQVDVIVLGCHRRSGFKELLLGSVSNYVTHHASCAVLVVPSQMGTSSPERQDQAEIVALSA